MQSFKLIEKKIWTTQKSLEKCFEERQHFITWRQNMKMSRTVTTYAIHHMVSYDFILAHTSWGFSFFDSKSTGSHKWQQTFGLNWNWTWKSQIWSAAGDLYIFFLCNLLLCVCLCTTNYHNFYDISLNVESASVTFMITRNFVITTSSSGLSFYPCWWKGERWRYKNRWKTISNLWTTS